MSNCSVFYYYCIKWCNKLQWKKLSLWSVNDNHDMFRFWHHELKRINANRDKTSDREINIILLLLAPPEKAKIPIFFGEKCRPGSRPWHCKEGASGKIVTFCWWLRISRRLHWGGSFFFTRGNNDRLLFQTYIRRWWTCWQCLCV